MPDHSTDTTDDPPTRTTSPANKTAPSHPDAGDSRGDPTTTIRPASLDAELSPVVGRNAYSQPEIPRATTQSPPPVSIAPLARRIAVLDTPAAAPPPTDLVTTVLTGLLTLIGLNPLASPNPTTPVNAPPLVELVWSVFRRIDATVFNRTPDAVDDTVTTSEDIAKTGNVLANDTDDDGDALKATLLTGPQHGTLALDADGSFTYTPTPAFNGVDSFTYAASDHTDGTHVHGLLGFFTNSGHTDVATVSITVAPVNHPPTANDDSFDMIGDIQLSGNVLANDTDVDGDALTATMFSGPTNGDLLLNIDGSFTYTPRVGFNGSDTFTYTASDGVDSSNVTAVNVTVVGGGGGDGGGDDGGGGGNEAPVAGDDGYSVEEDSTVSGNVLSNDNDNDGDPLTTTLVSGPAHGNLAFNEDGSFSYTPEPNFNGEDGFSYIAADGSVTSSVASVTISINSVNDVPVAIDDSVITDENGQLMIDVLANDTDVEGDALTAWVDSGPTHGSVVADSGSLTYTPAAGFHGVDSFTYAASDGTDLSNTATVTIDVVATDDPSTG